MSELQSDSVESEVIESTEVEKPDNGAELATASESEHSTNTEPVDEVESELAKKQAYINTQYGEKKQLERELEAERARVAEFEQKQREIEAAKVGNIPPMPDAFDDDYEEKVKARDEALLAQANFNAQQSLYAQQQEAIKLQQQQAAQAEAMQLQNDFVSKAKAAGASDQEFDNIVNTLNVGGMTPQGANAIMSLGEDGYFVAKHLAANAMEASEFNSLSPIQQGMKLVELKQKASALKPKTSNAPEPATNLQGNGVDPEMGKYPLIKGAKFE